MNLFDWLADKFRARERRMSQKFYREQRERDQARCPHKNQQQDGLGDIRCLDCGADLTE